MPAARMTCAVALAFTLVACGETNDPAEVNAPGDIPDSQVFVAFTTADRAVTVKVPEGWARRTDDAATVFADKLLEIRVETQPGTVTEDRRPAGPVVLLTYTGQSTPDSVTGKTGTAAVERYLFWHNGTEVVLTLSAPAGTDTTDALRTITDSVSWP